MKRRPLNRLNAVRPADDFATYGTVVADALAHVVAAPGEPRDRQRVRRLEALTPFPLKPPNVLSNAVGAVAIA